MDSISTILIAMLAVYGFYCALAEIRTILLRFCRKTQTNVPTEIDKKK